MKKIGYILYCIFIIITSITINVFIGNSDRNLDYIMNDVIEHYTCDEEEEECAGGVGAGAGGGGDYLYYKNNCLEKHQDSLKELIKDECLIGIKTGDICPLEDGDVKNFCKDRIYGHTWASPIQNTSEYNQDTNHLNN